MKVTSVWLWATMLACAACHASGHDTDSDTGDATDSNDTGAGHVPEACDGTTPFESAACGAALRVLCNTHRTEAECTNQAAFILGSTYLCGWAKVVKFTDDSTCTVASVTARCEAGGITGDLPCLDPCDGLPQSIHKGLSVIASERELIQMPCAPGGYRLSGPVGEWTETTVDEYHVHSCGADLPPPPPLCDCTPVACEQTP